MQSIFTQSLLKCRLCWRITFGVFVLILLVESALLIPSAQRFTQIETQRIATRTQMTVDPALMLGGGLNGQGPLARDLATLASQFQLNCLLVRAADGSEIGRAGDVAMAKSALPTPATPVGREPIFTKVGESMLIVTWRSLALGEPTVSACVDTTHIHNELIDYLLRIKGMVLIIVLVVTAGTMLLLYFALLKPILQLRQSAIAAGATPKQAANFILATKRRDELGDLIGAHNTLLTHVTDSMQREAAQADEREKYVARHDPVTRLPNRVALKEYLQRVGGSGDGEQQPVRISLFLIDLAGAHAPAAELQTRFGNDLQQLAGAGDLVAQLGPTQFALLRCGDERQQRIHSASIAESIVRIGRVRAAEVKIGVVEAAPGATDADSMLAEAEFALNRVRTDATSQYQFFDNQSAEAARERQLLTRELASAIANRDLVIWYQPKFSLNTPGLLEGVEALVRWPHATRGMVSPAAFVPLAEATGLIESLDRYVFTAVCAQINRWSKQCVSVPRIGINIAAPTFAQPSLAEELQQTLEAAGISPEHIEIEVTESVAMRDAAQTGQALRALRALGIETAIDDFGTGYSSLSYLRRFEVDTLKIDRSFVEEIGRNQPSETICAAIVRLGQALGTRVIAEGVETEAQATFLRTHGCDQVQGYLFGKPLAPDLFASTWLTAKTFSAAPLSAGE